MEQKQYFVLSEIFKEKLDAFLMSNKHKLSLIQVFPRVINDTKIVIGCFITGSNATNVCEALLKLTV